ncbi:MAG: uracil-DNA glycosylase [Saprospiraceae bacterium]|nr:uracil-DNA glycosylase [Saprospiraceae bacterium]MBK7524069.1 uracil-DNA glycosylase [Saprospiraceae bacterium]MBK8078954.1 uracil-DNA glycosylase [Saprospiraceae bacterium]MBK8372123.1 uracil-DNA glycosylase [Saprospiraceae bacterium]MBK8852733.1 uracil-DNA glycosylase [Saprospiraceae bacterium]
MSTQKIQIEESWKKVLHDEFEKPYFQKLTSLIKEELKNGKVIYPPGPDIFKAFEMTPFEKVKVVILGQDPYHNPGEAMGLSFSVPKGIKIPPSLKNIFKEIKDDVGLEIPDHGDLTNWATQGVFLLNAMLTVEKNRAGAHKDIGWQTFTNVVIQTLSSQKNNLVFLLWGNFARSKKEWIDTTKHLVLEAAHPSPLAGGAFFGCKHFSKANEYLIKNGQTTINWELK